MSQMTGFGERLRAALLAAGMSQAQLADRLGLTRPSINAWLNGSVPRLERWASVADAVGSTVAWLFHGERQKTKGRA